MGRDSKIEWTHHTFNPWRGCAKVSAGCANCYAEAMSHRNPAVLGVWGPQGSRVIAAESMWREPLKWDKEAAAAGVRRRVFCASLADVFEGPESMRVGEQLAVRNARARLMRLIDNTPHLTWLLLTKRPQNVYPLLRDAYRDCLLEPMRWPDNMWIGTSVEDQAAAEARIPALLELPARVRFLSIEPLLGPVDLRHFLYRREGVKRKDIDWVIVGGESGPGARPMSPQWVSDLKEQCVMSLVPFFFKQWGDWFPRCQWEWNPDLVLPDDDVAYNITRDDLVQLKDGGDVHVMHRVGKKAAGRLLDGDEWNEMPWGGW
jgi:protein gp37